MGRMIRPLIGTALTVGLLTAPIPASGQSAELNAVEARWRDFLESDGVFGDYANLSFGGSALPPARQLVYASALAGQGRGTPRLDRRRAARALWVGVNLEYQAMLVSSGTPGETDPFMSGRREHAWRSLALAHRLREFLTQNPPGEIEEEARSRALWDQAMLRLDAIEAEAAGEVPYTSPSLRQQVREAVLAEFSPEGADQGGPNDLLMTNVGGAFERGQVLARTAAAAAVQASLALGRVYGYPPEAQRDLSEPHLAQDEAAGSPRAKGLFPRGEGPGAIWPLIAETVMRTFGGADAQGIVGDYAEARRALGVPKAVDVLALLSGAPEHNRYPEPRPVLGPYELDRLVGLAREVQSAVVAHAPAMPGGKRFEPFGIGARGEVRDGELGNYVSWFETQLHSRSEASLELEKLAEELRGQSASDPFTPLDEETVKQLAEVAVNVLPNTSPDRAIKLVRDYLREWLRTEVTKISPRFVELLGSGQEGTSSPRPASGGSRER